MDENKYKVFIPTAGTGSRLSNLTQYLNKALVSIGLKPNISYIIEKFDKQTEFIIALGYKGELIKQFLTLAYPDRIFKFVEIDKYEGEGSGLGYTILKSKEHLQAPFIFISNDTIILDEIPTNEKLISLENWIGYSKKPAGNNYRSVNVDKTGKVIGLYEKNKYPQNYSYIGLCGIKNYEEFWKSFEPFTAEVCNAGESFALEKMLSNINFLGVNFEWLDTGNLKNIDTIINTFKKSNDPEILPKSDESIWFIDDKVIKFHKDSDFIKNRVLRAKNLSPYIPEVLDQTENMYMYSKVTGNVFSKEITTENFKYLLDWLEKFWKPLDLPAEKQLEFKNTCLKFYKYKTYDRISAYLAKYNNIDNDREIINGKKVPSIFSILDKLDWDSLSDGLPVNFHGDLHFENILVVTDIKEKQLPFCLLDWRQDFSGILEYGDIYYDLAKLLHGLIISHEIINKNMFSLKRKMNEIDYDFLRKNINIDCEQILEDFIIKKGLSFQKTKILTALIFLNIAALHHYSYCHLLFYLGKNLLYNEIEAKYGKN